MSVDFKDLNEEMKKGMPIPFSKQFMECSTNGLTDKTKFFSFDERPDFLPAFPNRKMIKLIKSGKWKGNDLIVCGKFGGICNSGHNKCRAMRGLPPSQNEQLV